MTIEDVFVCEDALKPARPITRAELLALAGGLRRVASTSDLVEELKARGAREVGLLGLLYMSNPDDPDNLIEWETGRYLVFSLDSLEGEKP